MINEKAKDKLIVALDYNNMEDAKRLIEIIGDNVSIYKVGLESYLNTEGKLIDYLHEKGKKVFMFNIHCSNGSKTMSEVAKMVKNSNSESLLIGVTILTNLGQEDIEEIFKSNLKLEELILNMANIAKNSNMNGVVCSPHESKIIKEKLGSDFITVCPGVRPKFTLDSKGNSNDDQNRIMTPYDAIKNKVDFIVIGRPITKSENPLQSTKLILEEISKAL